VRAVFGMVLSANLAKSYGELSAEELLRSCAESGDNDAWEELIRRFHPMVYRTAFRTGRRYRGFQSSLCDDLEQSVYLHLADNNAKVLRRFIPQGPGSAFGYIQTITIRIAHDRMKSKAFAPLDTGLAVPDTSGENNLDSIVLSKEVKEFLRVRLSERDNRIVELHYEGGMTEAEIAAIAVFGLTRAGVGSVLTRARELVRREFPNQ